MEIIFFYPSSYLPLFILFSSLILSLFLLFIRFFLYTCIHTCTHTHTLKYTYTHTVRLFACIPSDRRSLCRSCSEGKGHGRKSEMGYHVSYLEQRLLFLLFSSPFHFHFFTLFIFSFFFS